MVTERVALFVDDDPDLLAAVEALSMGGLDGTRVIPIGSTDEAIRLCRDTPVDVVVSDENMAPMRGVEFLRQIRRIRPMTRLVLCTGGVTASLRAEAAAIPVDAFLSKPFRRQDLEAALGSGKAQ